MNQSNGTFVAVRFKEEIVSALYEYAKAFGVPNLLEPDEYHSTVVYSRKPLKNVAEKRDLNPHWVGKPIAFDVFNSTKDDGTITNCLVLKFRCPDMNARHYYLRMYEGATHDFPSYHSHVTLSYDIGDYDITKLIGIGLILPEIIITQEYSEELKDEDRREKAREEES